VAAQRVAALRQIENGPMPTFRTRLSYWVVQDRTDPGCRLVSAGMLGNRPLAVLGGKAAVLAQESLMDSIDIHEAAQGVAAHEPAWKNCVWRLWTRSRAGHWGCPGSGRPDTRLPGSSRSRIIRTTPPSLPFCVHDSNCAADPPCASP